jgi:SSS family transporter
LSFGWVDWTVLGAYFAITLVIGLWFGRREHSTHDFFLGGRKQHWLLAGMSIIATEISALTVIAVPGEAFKTDWSYLQMYAGSFVGRMLIVLLLLPAFYGGAVTTVYEYLGQRFGHYTRITASVFFFASRVFGSGIRLLVASLAVSQIFEWRLEWVVIGATGIAIVYATYGGIKAILWTDAFQALVYITAACVLIGLLFHYTPGHWTQNFGDAYYARKLHTFTWTLDPNNEKGFWLLTLNAVFTTMAAMGTDQDLTQRMLTCPNLRQSQKSLIFNAFAGFPIVCVFLLIGTLLFVYYENRPSESLPQHVIERHELILPYFISHGLPSNCGLQGLMVAAIFAAAMGSLSSAIGALASTAITDFYRPFTASRSEAHYLIAARTFTMGFGLILILVALAFQHEHSLLWGVFKWVSLVFGGMLGVFLLGVTTRTRGHDLFNVAAMLSSVVILVGIKLVQDSTELVYLAWPWWIVIGTVWTYVLAACARRRSDPPPIRTATARERAPGEL